MASRPSAITPEFSDRSDAEQPSDQATTLAMKRILLVDAQAHVLRVMKLNLDRNGYEVDTALNGETALRLLREQHYDVLITGSDVAHIDEHQLCRKVQNMFSVNAPLILVVADGDSEPEASAWIEKLPNVERLEKPVSLRWIVARLNAYFTDPDNTDR
jgi:two-component system alkaline phosphatase synthesis response regulator PhoP